MTAVLSFLSRSEGEESVFHHLLTRQFDVEEALPLGPSDQDRASDLAIRDRVTPRVTRKGVHSNLIG